MMMLTYRDANLLSHEGVLVGIKENYVPDQTIYALL